MIYCFNFKYEDKIPHNAEIIDEKKQKKLYLKNLLIYKICSIILNKMYPVFGNGRYTSEKTKKEEMDHLQHFLSCTPCCPFMFLSLT